MRGFFGVAQRLAAESTPRQVLQVRRQLLAAIQLWRGCMHAHRSPVGGPPGAGALLTHPPSKYPPPPLRPQFLMHASGYLLQLEIKQEKEASKEANPDKAERKRKERSRNVELLGRIADQPDAYMQREEEMFLIERGLERRRWVGMWRTGGGGSKGGAAGRGAWAAAAWEPAAAGRTAG